MKRRLLSISLAICMIISILPLMALAGDYEGHWTASYIYDVRERGWMMGDEQGNFRPDDSITRGEFFVILWRALGEPEPEGDCPFTDVPADAYYRDVVTVLHEVGIVSGYENGLLGPNDTLTREMALVMLARAFGLAPSDPSEAAVYTMFKDYADVSFWATNEASILILKGYVVGSGKMLLPKEALTRGEMAKLLVTVFDGEQEPDKTDEPAETTALVITLAQNPTTSNHRQHHRDHCGRG